MTDRYPGEGYSTFTDDERRALFAEPCDNATWPYSPPTAEELDRLPTILRLGCGHESSIGTRLMRVAADEIDRLRTRVEAAHKAEVAKLRDALAEGRGLLEKYAEHEAECNEHVLNGDTWGDGCNCGLIHIAAFLARTEPTDGD